MGGLCTWSILAIFRRTMHSKKSIDDDLASAFFIYLITGRIHPFIVF